MSGIDELEVVEVNGTRQTLLLRGEDNRSPVVLFVHGGPGYPLMWYSRAFDAPFLSGFVVVHWDQRNAGKSYDASADPHAATLSQIAADGAVVAGHLKRKLGVQKVLLVGHSWGTMVASKMAADRPEHFSAYLAVGTVADSQAGERLKFDLLRERIREAGDAAATEALQRLRPPPYERHPQLEQLGSLMMRFVGWDATCRKISETKFAAAILRNQEYSEDELGTAFKAMQIAIDTLAPFCSTYRAIEAVPRIPVPVYFVQGQHDLNTPTTLVHDYYLSVEAPAGKHWEVFEESAHFPMYEEPDRFLELMRTAHLDGLRRSAAPSP